MRLSRPWIFFVIVQAIGLAALVASKYSAVLWSLGFVALLPGDAWPAAAVEHLLWQGPLSRAIIPLELAAAVASNAVLWLILLRVIRSLRNRRVA